jgi:hypothetical protein
MLRRAALALLTLTTLTTACGGEPPTQEEIDAARAQVALALDASKQARSALELLGFLPVYTCGEPRRNFVGAVVESAEARAGCVSASAESIDATTDAVVVSFADGGCEVLETTIAGQVAFRYSGGEDRMELTADLRQLKVDGESLQAEVGYGTCGDESRFWAKAEGSLPGHPEYTFKVDGRVGKREGAPIIGGTTLLLDGPGELTGPEGTDRLTLTGVLYELGEYAPKQGEILLETADGHTVKATFEEALWRVGKMELVIDDHEPVTVPIVR